MLPAPPDRVPRGRRQRRFGLSLLLGLLLGAFPLPAQEPIPGTGSGQPRFLIESIRVEKAEKFSADIIVAESRLTAGRSYTEQELRDAVYRIVRLPLILDAEFSLRKGSVRGRYELVITVQEARRWFFGVDVEQAYWSRPISINGLGTTDWVTAATATAGRRFSVGRQGVLFVALGGSQGTLNLGYTQNDLFDRSVLLSLGYSFSNCDAQREDLQPGEQADAGCRTEIFDLGLDPTTSAWSLFGDSHRARFVVGVPLRGNESVRFRGSYLQNSEGIRRRAFDLDADRLDRYDDRREWQFNLSWVFNSIDDPEFPTRGHSFEAGIDLHSLTVDLRSLDLTGDREPLTADMRSQQIGLLFSGQRYWPLSRRQTFSAKVQGFLGRSEIENVPTEDFRVLDGEPDAWRAGLAVGHSMFLLRDRGVRRWRELRWETELEAFHGGTSPEFDLPDNPRTGFRISSGLKFRISWGVFQLRVSYVDPGDG